MISSTQRKHWLQAAVVSFGLMAACALQAAEPEAPAAPMDMGGAMSPMESMDDKSIAGEEGEGKRMCKGHMRDKMKNMMKDRHEKLVETLKLDEKQNALFETAMKQMRDSMHCGMDLHEQLKPVVESDQYDEKKVREIVRKHNASMEDKTVATSKAMHDFYQSLGPWQKAKFKTIKDDMHSKMKAHMKDGMKGEEAAEGGASAEAGAEYSHDHGGKTE